jgi:radical SAM superfamily enzyme YgiQ (UPF0313 family)
VDDEQFARASLVAFYLPMHTATRLAGPLIERARRVNPGAKLCAYGLYAPLNVNWLTDRGVDYVLGPEAEAELVAIATGTPAVALPAATTGLTPRLPHLAFVKPDRTGLPALSRYSSLTMPDGSLRVVGTTDATRGCKHHCRHCPIVPVYQGRFRAVPLNVVLDDIGSQVAAGAEHITFGDPDFLNGPIHARRLVKEFAAAYPDVSYDVTIKIEHLLAHANLLPVLRDTGCLFVTSAVESLDDSVLAKLRKGHTRTDFLRAVELCSQHELPLSPTFLPFTPWTTLGNYVELIETLDELNLVEQVAPIQLAIRLLVTDGSPLLELDDVQTCCGSFDPALLMWSWCHPDPVLDELQREAMGLVSAHAGGSRGDTFEALLGLARARAGFPAVSRQRRYGPPIPHVSEPWYCCAEPDARQIELV